MLFAGSVFAFSFIAIIGLFALKRFESGRGTILFPALRETADERALHLKAHTDRFLDEVERAPAHADALLRALVRLSALGAARIGERMQSRAYALADRFSHKHRFERRETNSDFLKRVGEHPMRTRPSDDTENAA